MVIKWSSGGHQLIISGHQGVSGGSQGGLKGLSGGHPGMFWGCSRDDLGMIWGLPGRFPDVKNDDIS